MEHLIFVVDSSLKVQRTYTSTNGVLDLLNRGYACINSATMQNAYCIDGQLMWKDIERSALAEIK